MTVDEAPGSAAGLLGHAAGSALLGGLPAEELVRVQRRLTPVVCPAGTILIAQGIWHGTMHILRNGVLDVHVETPHGETRRVARLGPGDCIGEMSLLTGTPASATVTALVDSELWALGHTEFLELLATCPALARNLAMVLGRRLSIANRATEPGAVRHMRLRTHPGLSPELPQSIARSVAYYLAMPLVILDYRRACTWRDAEQLAPPDSGHRDYRLAELLHPGRPMRLAVIPMADVADEESLQLQEWLSCHVTHLLALLETDDRMDRIVSRQDEPDADVTLWPVGEPGLPAKVRDVALVSMHGASNTSRALSDHSLRYDASVVRVLPPAGEDTPAQVAWLARHLAGLKVGVALGGGGARGYFHLGVLEALQRASVPVDYVGGCSIGSLVAAGLAAGMAVSHMADELDAAAPHLLKFTVPRKSLLSDRGLIYLYRDRLFGATCLEDLSMPIAIVAADILRRHEVIMQHGLVWKALLASTAIPGVYPPVWVGDHCLVDGGILDPVPAHATRSMGADVVIGVRLGAAPDSDAVLIPATDAKSAGRSPHVIDVMLRAFDTMLSGITSWVTEDTDVTLVADVPPIGLRDFARGRALLPAGHAALEAAWTQVTTLLPWLRSPEGAS